MTRKSLKLATNRILSPDAEIRVRAEKDLHEAARILLALADSAKSPQGGIGEAYRIDNELSKLYFILDMLSQ